MLSLAEKVEKLNKKVNGTLSITYYNLGWELSSYEFESLFSIYRDENGTTIDGAIRRKTFEEVVNRAYKIAFPEKPKEELSKEESNVRAKS